MSKHSNLSHLDCVECGSIFDIEETTSCGNTVFCPFCGRANNMGEIVVDGFQIEQYDDVPELYLGGYLSETDDYDG